jgi:hypothetical protein
VQWAEAVLEGVLWSHNRGILRQLSFHFTTEMSRFRSWSSEVSNECRLQLLPPTSTEYIGTVNQHAPPQWFATTTVDCTGKQLCPSYTVSQPTGTATRLSHVALQCDSWLAQQRVFDHMHV